MNHFFGIYKIKKYIHFFQDLFSFYLLNIIDKIRI